MGSDASLPGGLARSGRRWSVRRSVRRDPSLALRMTTEALRMTTEALTVATGGAHGWQREALTVGNGRRSRWQREALTVGNGRRSRWQREALRMTTEAPRVATEGAQCVGCVGEMRLLVAGGYGLAIVLDAVELSAPVRGWLASHSFSNVSSASSWRSLGRACQRPARTVRRASGAVWP